MILRMLSVLSVSAFAVAALASLWLANPNPVGATIHSAVRSFSAPSVLPGDRLEVTIAASDYGTFGQVVETLPEGFVYVGSDLPEAFVVSEGRTVTFILLGEEQLTYTVTAPNVEGSYVFSGIMQDEDRVEEPVGGDSSVRVGPEPTATPTPDAHRDAHARTHRHANARLRRRPRPSLPPRPRPSPPPRPRLEPTATPTHAYRHAHARAHRHANARAHRHANARAYRHANARAHRHAHARAHRNSHAWT